MPMKPGLGGVFTGCSTWIHFPLRLSASSPSSANSSAHFLCPCPMISACDYLPLSLPPSLTFSSHKIFCNVQVLFFCILYFIHLKYQFCTPSIQVKFVCFVFFGILFLYIFIYHSGLIKYLHFTVQIFSGNVFLFLLHFKEPMVIT